MDISGRWSASVAMAEGATGGPSRMPGGYIADEKDNPKDPSANEIWEARGGGFPKGQSGWSGDEGYNAIQFARVPQYNPVNLDQVKRDLPVPKLTEVNPMFPNSHITMTPFDQRYPDPVSGAQSQSDFILQRDKYVFMRPPTPLETNTINHTSTSPVSDQTTEIFDIDKLLE